MKRPPARYQFTVRRLMVVVAVAGVESGMIYWVRESTTESLKRPAFWSEVAGNWISLHFLLSVPIIVLAWALYLVQLSKRPRPDPGLRTKRIPLIDKILKSGRSPEQLAPNLLIFRDRPAKNLPDGRQNGESREVFP